MIAAAAAGPANAESGASITDGLHTLASRPWVNPRDLDVSSTPLIPARTVIDDVTEAQGRMMAARLLLLRPLTGAGSGSGSTWSADIPTYATPVRPRHRGRPAGTRRTAGPRHQRRERNGDDAADV
jgi:hypothetical protein